MFKVNASLCKYAIRHTHTRTYICIYNSLYGVVQCRYIQWEVEHVQKISVMEWASLGSILCLFVSKC